MIDVQPDFFLAQLVVDYLKDDASITAGVPDEATLPKFPMDIGMKRDLPALVIAAQEEDPGKIGTVRKIILCPMLLTWLKASTENAANVAKQTTREDASRWMRQIDARLRDVAAWGAWVASLPVERRTGWRFLTAPRAGGDNLPLYDKGGTVSYGLKMTHYMVLQN